MSDPPKILDVVWALTAERDEALAECERLRAQRDSLRKAATAYLRGSAGDPTREALQAALGEADGE